MTTENQAIQAEIDGLNTILAISGDINVAIKEFGRCVEYDNTLDTFSGVLPELLQLMEKLEDAHDKITDCERAVQDYEHQKDLDELNAEALSNIGV